MNDVTTLDEEINALRENDAKLDAQLRELEQSMKSMHNEEAGAVMFAFLAELINTAKAIRYKSIETQRTNLTQRTKELEEARAKISSEKKQLIDHVMSEYKQSQVLDKEALKTLGFTQKTVDSLLETAKALDGTQSVSVFEMLRKAVDSVDITDIAQDKVKDKAKDHFTDTDTDTQENKNRSRDANKAKVRSRA